MHKICILALVGLPAVGKTSLCKLLNDDLKYLPFDIIHIDYDHIIDIKTERSSTVSYKQQRTKLLNDLEVMIKSLKTCKIIQSDLLMSGGSKSISREISKDDVLILCDDNHYYRSMRYKLCQMARLLKISYGQLYIESPMELAYQRNTLRHGNAQVPLEVFERMCNHMETPEPNVYNWELNTLHMKSEEINRECIYSLVLPFIIKLFEWPLSVEDASAGSSITPPPQSQFHNLDVLLRKKIGGFLNSQVDVDRKKLALMLNEKKKKLLKEFQMNKSTNEKMNFEKCLQLFEEFLENVMTDYSCIVK